MNAPLRESQQPIRAEQLAAKARQIRGVRSTAGLSPAERAAALGKAASGELYKADFSPIRITPAQHLQALEHIAANPNLSDFDYLRLVGTQKNPGALDKLLSGVGLQKNEEALLTKAFGPDMADALKNRGSGSLEANITNAMQPPRSEGPIPSSVAILGAEKFTPAVETRIAGQVHTAMDRAVRGLTDAKKQRAALLADMEKSITQGVTKEGGTGLSPQQQRLASGEKAVAGSVNSAMANYKPMTRNRLWRATIEALGVPRALQTTADLSATLRQGITLAAGHPIRFSQAFMSQVKALFSHDFARVAQEDITTHPDYGLAQKAGLQNLQVDEAVLTKREEAFMSHVLNRIPGIGSVTKASERAFLTFTNKLRHDLFYDQVNTWRDQGVGLTDRRLADYATYLNNATGRGSLKWLGQHAATANAVFYAPRFMASRFQLVGDLLRPSQDPFVRQLVAKDLAAFVGSGVAMLGVMKLAGANVQVDPRLDGLRQGQVRQRADRHVGRLLADCARGRADGDRREAVPGDEAGRVGAALALQGVRAVPRRQALAGRRPRAPGVPGTQHGRHDAAELRPLAPDEAQRGQPHHPEHHAAVLPGRALGLPESADRPAAPRARSPRSAVACRRTRRVRAGSRPPMSTSSRRTSPRRGSRRPTRRFASKGWRDVFARAGLNTAKYGTYADYRSAYIAHWAPTIAQQQNISAARAEDVAANAFDRLPAVQQLHAAVSQARLNFWKAHPDVLKQAADLGVESLSKQEQQILAAAGGG